MFPAKTIAQVLWGVAVFVLLLHLIYEPLGPGLLFTISSIANIIIYPGGIAAFGAVIHLLGEIRDALPRKEREP